MGDRSVRILLLLLLILGIFLGIYEGIWEQGARKVVNPDILLPAGNEIYLEVIWDASGSMWGREYGVEKIIRSKEVLKTFTSEIPERVNLGLRIFGSRRVDDLKDSFLAIPFQEEDREGILNFITNVKPLGKSPIAYSLREAKDDLKKVRGKKFILLVSDGIDNGNLPTAEVIREIKDNDIILHVVHIGDLNDRELKLKLKEMAESTGGRYFTYQDYNKVIPTLKQYE